MKIRGDDPVVDQLLSGNDRIVFNLVLLLRTQDGARLYTDGKSFLSAQADASRPLWLYVNDNIRQDAESEISKILSEALREHPKLKINAREGFTENLLFRFAKEHGLHFSKRCTLNAYAVRSVNEIPPVGEMIASEAKDIPEIAKLIQIAATDDNDGKLSDEEALRFARKHAETGNLFFWRNGEIVSMARVIRYGTEFARINSVVTKREARGKGYAKMLVGEIAKRLLKEGLTPVLYAHADNPSSNRCYLNCGFENYGEICEFLIEK